MGRIICIEGSDYSGKTSIAWKLVDNYRGEYNRGMLSTNEKAHLMARSGNSSTNTKEATDLFTNALRLDKLAYLNESHPEEELIFQDRYYPSVVAYGRTFLDQNYIKETENFKDQFLQPDLLIFLYCSYEEKIVRSAQRKRKTKTDKVVLSDVNILRRIESELVKIITQIHPRISLDTSKLTIDEITENIRQNPLFQRVVVQK